MQQRISLGIGNAVPLGMTERHPGGVSAKSKHHEKGLVCGRVSSGAMSNQLVAPLSNRVLHDRGVCGRVGGGAMSNQVVANHEVFHRCHYYPLLYTHSFPPLFFPLLRIGTLVLNT